MREIFGKIKAFYMQKKKLAVGVTVAVLGVLAAVGVYAMIPEVKAAAGTENDPIPLSAGTTTVTGGQWYQITGTSSDTYILNYHTDGPDNPVNLILKDFTWNGTADKSAIVFTTDENIQRTDANDGFSSTNVYTSDSSGIAKFNVTIQGKNQITGADNATKPLISAESIIYDVTTFEYGSSMWFSGTYEARIVRDCDVVFKGDNNSNDVLILKTGQNSTGAAIGSADTTTLSEADKFVLSEDTSININDKPNPQYENEEGYLKEIISQIEEYGAGNIEITTGANIIIYGNGNGAGIGTGASSTATVNYRVNSYNDTMGSVRAEDILKGNSVTISGGSVSVHMSDDALGCCIGVGAIANVAQEKGTVQITGGNVDLQPSAAGYKFGEAKNGDTKVYMFGLKLTNDKLPLVKNSDYDLVDYEGDRNVSANYSGDNNSNRDGYLTFTVEADDLNSFLDSGGKIDSDYVFNGYAKAYFDEWNATEMYFYLPTATLPKWDLTIEGDMGGVNYSYSVAPDSTEIAYTGRAASVKQTKEVTIYLRNISKYCEKTVTYTINGKSYSTTLDDNNEGSITFAMPAENCNVDFHYEVPKYKISYNFGVGESYKNSIDKNNYEEWPYGESYTLKEPTWSNHVFLGWYLEDDVDGEEVTELQTPDDPNNIYTYRLYAKWGCEVSFVEEDGTVLKNLKDQNGNNFENPFVLPLNAAGAILYSEDYPQDLPDTTISAFDGWKVGDTYYKKSEDGIYDPKTITENTVFQAVYQEIGYDIYVYTKFNDPELGIKEQPVQPGLVGDFAAYFKDAELPLAEISEEEQDYYLKTENNILADGIDGSKMTFRVGAKKGYSISQISIYDSQGDIVTPEKKADDENAYEFVMPTSDIYIDITFDVRNYEVHYFNVYEKEDGSIGIEELTDSERFLEGTIVREYNKHSELFSLVPLKNEDKYKRFAGWTEVLSASGNNEEVIRTQVDPAEDAKDIYLYAVWEDVVTYPIIVSEEAAKYITVYDTDRNLPVDKGIPGEKLNIVVEIPRGVSYDSMTWYYKDVNNSDCTLLHTPASDEKSPYEYTFIMPPASPVRIEGEFSLIEYRITYLNLNGAANPNPTIYTVENKIDLEALEIQGVEFMGWNIVLPDEDNYIDGEHFATKEEPITQINGEEMSGNIILVAHWDPEDEIGTTLYKILIDSGLLHGTMDTFATEAYQGQYVFFSAVPDKGYRLKNISYTDTEPQVYSAQKAMRAIEGILNTEFDVPLYEVADGIYYFIMPDHDVNLIAEFEPIEYTITYIDGYAEDNPAVYTIEDEIWLTAPSKDGFEFLGWYDEEGNLVSSIVDSTGNLILTAKWRDLNPEPETPEEPDTPAAPDDSTNQDSNTSPDQPEGNTNNSNSSIDKLLAWINNSSKVDSSEDQAANKNKGITQQLSTGDQANINHFALLCVLSLIIIIIACPKRKEEEEETE